MSIRSIASSWIKWRRRRRHKRPPNSNHLRTSSTTPSEVNETDDEFLQYFRQYRQDKNALPEGWVQKLPSSPTTFRDDSLSRDSGRSSGGVTDDSPVSAEARNLLPSRPWLDKQHFFNRPVDEFSEYSYCSPKEDEDSGVSSITTFDLRQNSLRHHLDDLPDLWDASSVNSTVLPLTAVSKRPEFTSSVEIVQILKWWLSCLICLLAVIVFVGSFWVNQLQCNHSGKAFDIASLSEKLNNTVFGQDLAVHSMMSLVNDFNREASFFAVALLLGHVGTGKSHVTALLNKAFLHPKNVFRLSSSHPLLLADMEARWLQSCGPSLLSVENTEQLPPGHLEKIAQIATEKKKRLLILATTTMGSASLNMKTLEWMKAGKRQDITLSMVTSSMLKFEEIQLPVPSLRTNLIPFLPLTRDYVIQCIWKQVMDQGGGNIVFTPDQVQWVLEQTEFFSTSFPLFATDGCKRVAENVGVVIAAQRHFSQNGMTWSFD